jgi:hypothetical protein
VPVGFSGAGSLRCPIPQPRSPATAQGFSFEAPLQENLVATIRQRAPSRVRDPHSRSFDRAPGGERALRLRRRELGAHNADQNIKLEAERRQQSVGALVLAGSKQLEQAALFVGHGSVPGQWLGRQRERGPNHGLPTVLGNEGAYLCLERLDHLRHFSSRHIRQVWELDLITPEEVGEAGGEVVHLVDPPISGIKSPKVIRSKRAVSSLLRELLPDEETKGANATPGAKL